MKCLSTCQSLDVACPIKECRSWIDFEEDRNCLHEAISKNGAMTLREVAVRMGVSFVRIKQIEEKALAKMSKKGKNKLDN
jgi:DNA-directed RNA polymerase sigma subunit (sigma70/sigma32)